MKKVLYSVALVAALGLASCGAKTTEKDAEGTPNCNDKEQVDSLNNGKCGDVCCKDGEECTNEECNKEGKCTGACAKECDGAECQKDGQCAGTDCQKEVNE